MKKGVGGKLIVFCLAIFILVMPTVFAYDVAYIAKNSKAVDQNIVNSFKELNLSVGIVLDSNVRTTDFSKYRLVVISDNILRQTAKYYDISKYKTIVINRNYGEQFGLTDKDGISQLASSFPLNIVYDNSIIQVYNAAVDRKGIAIPYYYLDKENIAQGFVGVAETYKGGDEVLGHVTAIANPNSKLINGKTTKEKICFFGIAKSNYWTPFVKKLFKTECAEFVAIECYNNSECNDGKANTEDVCVNPGKMNSKCQHYPIICSKDLDCGTNEFIGDKFCTNKDVMRNFITYSCLNPGTGNSSCTSETKEKLIPPECNFGCANGLCLVGVHDVSVENLQFKKGNQTINNNILVKNNSYSILIDVFNNGDFYENVSFSGQIKKESLVKKTFTHTSVENLNAKDSKLGKTRAVLFDLTPGMYNVSVEGNILLDINLNNNKVQKQVLVVNCISNSDCSQDEICVNPGIESSYCQPLEIKCRNELDCGVDGFIGGSFCSGKDVKRSFLNFTCNNPGKTNSFCSNATEQRLIESCSFSCLDGKCNIPNINCSSNSECNDNNPNTLDECVNPGTEASSCRHAPINCASNLDCGFIGFVGNEFCNAKNIIKNFQNATCRNPGQATSYCIIESNPITINQCTYSCSNGACVRCNLNSECNDNNFNTKDTCVNPGTKESHCRNEPTGNINCTSEIDCGADGFSGNLFCQNNNAYQNYNDYSCNFPNTLQSVCSNNVNARLKQVCQYGCTNGVCNNPNIICSSDLECKDNNPLTYDQCINPGTTASFCRNTEMNCASNLDCGFTGFVGGNYCSINSIINNYQTSICSNAGTLDSYCSLTLNQRTIDRCQYTCSQGACVRCGDDLDCDDDNSNTIDKCINPKTKESYCKNTDTFCGENQISEYKFSTTLIANDSKYVMPAVPAQANLTSPQYYSDIGRTWDFDNINILNSEDKKYLTNEFNLSAGKYVAKISEGAWSRWRTDGLNSSIWGGANRGGGFGFVWESSADIIYNKNQNLIMDKFGIRNFFNSKNSAETAAGEKIIFNHDGGKLYLVLDDYPIYDNRGSITVDVYKCSER